MKKNNIVGVIFGNTHDHLLGEMTELRAISSIPFGGRYRLIDFPLSNLVNADVIRVAVVTNSNYKSLMDHLGSGKSWDLARRHGGLFIMPPFVESGTGRNADKIQSLHGIIGFLEHGDEEYVALCDGDVVSNIDMTAMMSQHIETGADVTVAYTCGAAPRGENDVLKFSVKDDKSVSEVMLARDGEQCEYSLDTAIIRKDLLISIIEDAVAHGYTSIARDVFIRGHEDVKIYGYKVTDYSAIIDSMQTYIKANMDLLDKHTRDSLLAGNRPIYTKVRDEMPAKYGLDSKVRNSLVADGCIIEGEVINSVLFRGVKVGKGSVVRNCVIMQDTTVGENATLDHVCADKDTKINDGRTLSGSDSYTVFIRKSSEV